jgi:hypothetical protein
MNKQLPGKFGPLITVRTTVNSDAGSRRYVTLQRQVRGLRGKWRRVSFKLSYEEIVELAREYTELI